MRVPKDVNDVGRNRGRLTSLLRGGVAGGGGGGFGVQGRERTRVWCLFRQMFGFCISPARHNIARINVPGIYEKKKKPNEAVRLQIYSKFTFASLVRDRSEIARCTGV